MSVTVKDIRRMLEGLPDDALFVGDAVTPYPGDHKMALGYLGLTAPLTEQMYGDSSHYMFFTTREDAEELSIDGKAIQAVALE